MTRTASRVRRPARDFPAEPAPGPSGTGPSGTGRPTVPARSRRPRRPVSRRLRLPLMVAVAGAGATLLSAGAAYAYWGLTDNSHPAGAVAGTLTAPGGGGQNGTATPTGVPVSWSAPSGYTPTGYTVLRCQGTSCTPATPVPAGNCHGPVTATGCTDNDPSLQPGTTYTYAVTGSLDNWTSPAGSSFPGATTGPAKLAFSRQPDAGADIQATGTGTFDVSVAVEDSQGVTVANDSTDRVTLAIDHNPGQGVLSCQGGLTATASAGVAAFTGCAITKAGDGYTLTASSSSLTAPAGAHSFDITAGQASQLVFTTSAFQASKSASATNKVTVQQQDTNGNPASAGTGGATVALSAKPSAGAVFAASPGGPAVSGVTIAAGSSSADFYFGDNQAGSPVITAASGGLSASQTEFIGAVKLAASPSVSGPASSSANVPITVQLQTKDGTPVTTGATVALSSSSTGVNEFSASSGGTPVTSVTIPAGQSSVTFYYGDELAGSPTVTASVSGDGSARTAVTVTPGPATGLTFSGVSTGNANNTNFPAVSCTGTVGSPSFSCALSRDVPGGKSRFLSAHVTLVDQFQNLVTNTTGSDITVALSQNGGSSLSTSSVTIPAGAATSSAPFTESLADGTSQVSVSATATIDAAAVQAALSS